MPWWGLRLVWVSQQTAYEQLKLRCIDINRFILMLLMIRLILCSDYVEYCLLLLHVINIWFHKYSLDSVIV